MLCGSYKKLLIFIVILNKYMNKNYIINIFLFYYYYFLFFAFYDSRQALVV